MVHGYLSLSASFSPSFCVLLLLQGFLQNGNSMPEYKAPVPDFLKTRLWELGNEAPVRDFKN